MRDSKYLLTNDFKILYCPNINLKLACKELDCKTMEFIKYKGDCELIESFIEMDSLNIDLIINNILNATIGIELIESDMNWIELFDSLLENNMNILNNNKLVFNYCVLKLRLLGFPERMALEITSKQFINQHLYENYPNHTFFIDKINEILDKRVFWISNKTMDHTQLEEIYFKTIFDYKCRLKHNFDFNMFKNEYLDIVEKSFIPHLIKFNAEYSYLIRNPLPVKEQLIFIEECYVFIITGVINKILKRDYQNILWNNDFISDLITDLLSVVKLYLKIIMNDDKI